MSKWQPIETAPMEPDTFRPVLLWMKEFNTPTVAGWCDGQWVTPDDYFDVTGTPTHWMPLPEPPPK